MTVKANASQALTAVLAIPLIIPLIIAITELSTLAINNLPINLASSSLWIVTGCDLFVLALAFLLFPYLWRE
jgi:heme exporter protein B